MFLYVNPRFIALITASIFKSRLVAGNSAPPGSMLPSLEAQTLPPSTPNLATHGAISSFIVVTAPASSIPSSVPPGLTTSPSAVAPIATMSLPSSLNQNQVQSFGYKKDYGHELGSVTVHNHCAETLYLASVGAHPLGGYKDKTTGYGTAADEIQHHIFPGGSYTEPYRFTCPIPVNETEGTYKWAEDKLSGQGVSMKVSRTSNKSDITQIEWALLMNPKRNDKFYRLDYDISLLNCADPAASPAVFKVNLPPPTPTESGKPAPTPTIPYNPEWRNLSQLTDALATPEDHQFKIQACPGYQGGIKVSFPNNTVQSNCTAIDCKGKMTCLDIYTFDRTRVGEASMACDAEYRGDMVVDLCADRMNKTGSVR
ncbi:hypothetical protein BDU57DRAFT_515916 [Ampelomyces quisqualis]|uniref:Uncharacterized protein n=1 Tax=Ampelomyces quisqualis TaxID=50730 RepID=A0A6A5QN02_AMPQU|nr:hypothetical protein BDU57DRAFT_515916 [Ampelomyces quisqualis]